MLLSTLHLLPLCPKCNHSAKKWVYNSTSIFFKTKKVSFFILDAFKLTAPQKIAKVDCRQNSFCPKSWKYNPKGELFLTWFILLWKKALNKFALFWTFIIKDQMKSLRFERRSCLQNNQNMTAVFLKYFHLSRRIILPYTFLPIYEKEEEKWLGLSQMGPISSCYIHR